LLSPAGKFTHFDAPGADLTPEDFNGTFPSQINLFGVIAGTYIDANFVAHGFLQSPCNFWEDCQNDERANRESHSLLDDSSRILSPLQGRLQSLHFVGPPVK
jgi:hypothetical protein